MFSHMMPYFTWFFLKYPCEWFYILTIIGMYWSKICPSFLLLSTRLLFHCPSALVERFSFRIWSILQRFSWHTRGVFRTPSNIYDGFFFAKIVNNWKVWIIFTKSFILDDWLGSECATAHVWYLTLYFVVMQ